VIFAPPGSASEALLVSVSELGKYSQYSGFAVLALEPKLVIVVVPVILTKLLLSVPRSVVLALAMDSSAPLMLMVCPFARW
jgi:hypothetical protein